MSPYLTPPTPAHVRAALVAHLSRKLGWCDRTASHILGPLSNSEIARCLADNPDQTRRALWDRSCAAIAAARAA